MLDIDYKPKPGLLADIDITYLCLGDTPMISPFVAKQVGNPSAGLSSAGYDLRLGAKYLTQNETICFDLPLDPLNPAHHEFQWDEYESKDGIILVPPLGCVLAETIESVNMPYDVTAIILGKSTYARCNLLVNATPIENGFRGIITLELHNCSPI